MITRNTFKSRSRRFCCLSSVSLVAMVASAWSQQSDQLLFDFEDGTAQGWTTVSSDTNVPHAFTVTNALTENGEILPTPASGSFQVLPIEFESVNGVTNTRDGHHATLLMRSPEFVLTAGDVSIALVGGTAGGTLPGAPADLATATDTGDGVHSHGFGLRRVSDDTYVATGARSGNGNGYQDVVIPAVQLAGFANGTDTYTIDVFDSLAGSWGWIGFDHVRFPGKLAGGPYFQDFEAFADGVTDLGDGSTLTTNRVAVAGVLNNALQLTSDSVTQTRTTFLTPPMNLLTSGFRACFDYQIFDAPNEVINDLAADGFSFNIGAILPASAGDEEGFGTGLSIEFDTHFGGGSDIIGHNVAVNGVDVPGGSNGTDPHVDGAWHAVCIEWVDGAVSVSVDGADLFLDLPTPGFTPVPANVFAFAARTGGATETVLIDNISITPPAPKPTLELVVPEIGVVVFDGFPNQVFEFVNAARLDHSYGPAAGTPADPFALLAHDDDFLYVGARIPKNSLNWGEESSEIRFYFDPTFSRRSQPDSDHWYLSIKPYAANIDPQWFRGNGSGTFSRVVSPPFQWGALVETTGDDVSFDYSYEIRVSREFLGSWDEIDGFAIEHREPTRNYPAPESAVPSSPTTWARLTYSNSSPDLARVKIEGEVETRRLGFPVSPLAGQEVILSAQALVYKVETDATGGFEFDVPIPKDTEILIQLGSHFPMRLDPNNGTDVSRFDVQPIDLLPQDPSEAFRFPGCASGTTCMLARITFSLLEPPPDDFTMSDIRRRRAPVIAFDGGGTLKFGDDVVNGALMIDSGFDGLTDTQALPGDIQITAVGDGRRTAWPAVNFPSDGTRAAPASSIRVEGTGLHPFMRAYMADNEVFGGLQETHRLEVISVDRNGQWIDFRLPTLTLPELRGYAFLRLRDDWLRPGVTSLKTVTQPFAFREPPFPTLRGFGWENKGSSSSFDEFLAAYGDSAYLCLGVPGLSCITHVPDPFYHLLWWPIYFAISPGENGLCVGMVSTSLLFDQGSIQPGEYDPGIVYPAAWKLKGGPAVFEYDGFLGPLTGPPHPVNFVAEVRKNHGVQTSAEYIGSWLSDIARGPVSVKNEIRSNLTRRVVCFKPSDGFTGHCVAPFDARSLTLNQSLFEIYDPNYPGETHYLTIDSSGYRLVGEDAKWQDEVITASPLTIWTRQRHHPLDLLRVSDDIALLYSIVSGDANGLYENSQGEQWGWDASGQFVDTMPDAGGIAVFDTPATDRKNAPVAIPVDSGAIEIAAMSRGGDFSLHTGVGGVAFSLDVSGAQIGENDTLMTSSAGHGSIELQYRPAIQRQGLAPRLGMEMGNRQSAVFQLLAVEANPGGVTCFRAIAADRCIEVMNGGPSYSLQIDSADGASGRVASLEFGPFSIPGDALHRLEIANWPTASLLRSSVDADGDGVFESVALIRGRRNPNGLFTMIPGDMNSDGIVDTNDVEPLTVAVNTPDDFESLFPGFSIALGDIIADGVVDQLDLDALHDLIAVGNPPPVIESVTWVSDHIIRLKVTGLPGQRYQLQASGDLSEWVDGHVEENISGTVEFTETVGDNREGYRRVQVLD